MKLVDLVFSTVIGCHLSALFPEVLLKKWINDKLFGDGVADDLPGELA
jgi:hypothetical protein